LKIVYLHQYFKTPETGGAIRSYYLAKALVEAGHQVEMVSTHSADKYQVIDYEGIKVHYLAIPYNNQMGFWARVKAFIKFFWQSYWLVFRLKNIDLIYATSTPITVGLTAWLLKKTKGTPYFFELRDWWPKVPIELGFIKNGLLKRFLYRLEHSIYLASAKIITLSPSVQIELQKKYPQKSIHLIPNIADVDFFKPAGKPEDLEKMYHIENQYVVSYFGTMGFANHLAYLLNIAEECQKQSIAQFQFWLIGEGAEIADLQLISEKKRLKNIRFFPLQNKAKLWELLALTDIVYVSFLNHPILETTSPNKFFEALAAGKLLIVNTKGWLQELVENHECGFYLNPEQPQHFVKKIKAFIEDKTLLTRFKANSRLLAEQKFARKKLIRDFLGLFNS
jgi:glycosyltransferase involved in cell wall biosynthesis